MLGVSAKNLKLCRLGSSFPVGGEQNPTKLRKCELCLRHTTRWR